MSIDLTNEKGGHWKCSNSLWPAILDWAVEQGWKPQGTVLYKRGQPSPELIIVRIPPLASSKDADTDDIAINVLSGPGDGALAFEDATKSGELYTDWDGSYLGNDGQVITPEDAANFAAALRKVKDWGLDTDYAQELIEVLEVGAVRIT